MYKVFEQNGVDIENIDGAELHNVMVRNLSGIAKGVLNECAIFQPSSNSIAINTGLFIVKGVRIKIVEPEIRTFSSLPTVSENWHIIIQVILSSDKSLTASIIFRKESSLIQDDILKNEQGTYEIEIVRFTLSNQGVSNIKKTMQTIDLGLASNNKVIANPNEESTEELNSILIDGTVYSIPKGGEGSGIRTLETAPTTATEGFVGEIVQVSDGTAYQCVDITDNNYTWVKILLETAINYIVKKGLTENTETLTDKEKTKATEYIGALKKVTTNTGLVRAYIINPNGSQETRILATSAGSMLDGRIPVVFSTTNTQGDEYPGGHLLTAFPKKPYHCVNLDFIERKVKKYTHNITITFNNEAGIEFTLNFEIHNSQSTAYTEISQVIDLALIPKRSSGSSGEPIYPIIDFWDTGFAFVSLGASGTLSTNAQFVQFSNCTFVDTVT